MDKRQGRKTQQHKKLLWMADKLQSDQGEHAHALWAAKGKQGFGDG